MKRDEHFPFASKDPADTVQTDRTWDAKDSQEFRHRWRNKPTMVSPQTSVKVVNASRSGRDQGFYNPSSL